ncbi:MAG: hypothetical protein OHK93_006445 [Ramalina farinacea]|uniref:Histone chaperone RTT106/FACT complex subunit SPT16-like middle domain-containing protein n=1 Tax=Ramalina farinacea TaxID=258253 RepID=A0AA43QK15_9LECA|nr:hypothetical protein [Ramalina farinacea]
MPKVAKSPGIDQAFAQRNDLKHYIHEAIAKQPNLKPLFEAISDHINNTVLRQTSATIQPEPASKKRKLDSPAPARNVAPVPKWAPDSFYYFNDISFSIPQRKKLKLDVGKLPEQGIRATNAEGEVELDIKWADIREITCLPIPEKAHAAYNFCVFTNASRDSPDTEQVVWTVQDAIPKDDSVDPKLKETVTGTYRWLLLTSINEALKPYNKSVTIPGPSEFVSQLAQAHRKGEMAYHVRSFRGAKDGYLFLLSSGIIWGFKKPLEYFPFDVIESVSYTSVLQRTFNLNIAIRRSSDDETQEFEFSMVDQADFGGIDAYVKRHSLQDASMAEQRRAKRLNVNGVKGQDAEQGNDAGGELEKAAREAQDMEDEDEEDDENFDPGSAGESEGEGSESGEEGDEPANGDAGDDSEDDADE